jgi:CBS domain-containing protein
MLLPNHSIAAAAWQRPAGAAPEATPACPKPIYRGAITPARRHVSRALLATAKGGEDEDRQYYEPRRAFIGPETTLREARPKMKEIDSGALPVAEHDKLIGKLTDRDIVIRGIDAGRGPDAEAKGSRHAARDRPCSSGEPITGPAVAWAEHLDRAGEKTMSNFKTPADKKTKDEPGASVDEQIDDSFPASDPPSYNAGGRVGSPHRQKENQKEKEPAKSDK